MVTVVGALEWMNECPSGSESNNIKSCTIEATSMEIVGISARNLFVFLFLFALYYTKKCASVKKTHTQAHMCT